jgi:tRNA(Leu) C34 or U34 (ribose-2'-O)-methylase TrmL
MSEDVLIVGSEHYGFLKNDLAKILYRVKIPMLPNRRSINMAISAAIVLSEAMSQLKWPIPRCCPEKLLKIERKAGTTQ